MGKAHKIKFNKCSCAACLVFSCREAHGCECPKFGISDLTVMINDASTGEKKLLELKIVVDTNDADYMTAINDITEKRLAKLMPVIEAIKRFKPYKVRFHRSYEDTFGTRTHDNNYPTSEMVRHDLGQKEARDHYKLGDELHDLFEEYCPSPEFGFHTVDSIEVYEKPKKRKLL